jgi:hypothetical protein
MNLLDNSSTPFPSNNNLLTELLLVVVELFKPFLISLKLALLN